MARLRRLPNRRLYALSDCATNPAPPPKSERLWSMPLRQVADSLLIIGQGGWKLWPQLPRSHSIIFPITPVAHRIVFDCLTSRLQHRPPICQLSVRHGRWNPSLLLNRSQPSPWVRTAAVLHPPLSTTLTNNQQYLSLQPNLNQRPKPTN